MRQVDYSGRAFWVRGWKEQPWKGPSEGLHLGFLCAGLSAVAPVTEQGLARRGHSINIGLKEPSWFR